MRLHPLIGSRFPVTCLLLALGLALCACSKQGGKPAVMTSTIFDSAPPELKHKWQTAAEYAAARNYLGTVTNLIVILGNSQQLTSEQNAALNQAWTDIGNQAFQAGEKGDKMAVQAVLEMRNSGFGKSRGDR